MHTTYFKVTYDTLRWYGLFCYNKYIQKINIKMTNDQNKTLLELKLKLAQKQKAQRFKKILYGKLTAEKTKLNRFFEIMQKEEQDVKNLEELSIVSMYYSLFGDKQQQLNKEQVEFFAAKLKFDSCQNSITSMKREVIGYQIQIDDCDKYEAGYIESLKNNNDNNNQYLEITDKIARLNSTNIEMSEAIVAGKLAKVAIKGVIKKMQSASNWGLVDMFGGGMIVTAIKHSKLNQSQKMVENVKVLIDKFHRELDDIDNGFNSELEININGFGKFADYFFDGLIFDWVVQSKINKCLNAFIETEKEISQMVNLLLIELSKSKTQVGNINQSKLDLFEIDH